MARELDTDLISKCVMVLPKNVIRSTVFMDIGVGIEFVSTDKCKKITTRIFLHKHLDESVTITLTTSSAHETDLARPEHVLIEDVQCCSTSSDICAETFVQCARKSDDNFPMSRISTSNNVQQVTASSQPQHQMQHRLSQQQLIIRKQLAAHETFQIESNLSKMHSRECCGNESSDEDCSSQSIVVEARCDTNVNQPKSAEHMPVTSRNEQKVSFRDTCKEMLPVLMTTRSRSSLIDILPVQTSERDATSSLCISKKGTCNTEGCSQTGTRRSVVLPKTDVCRTKAMSVTRTLTSPKTALSSTAPALDNSVGKPTRAAPESLIQAVTCGSSRKHTRQQTHPQYKRGKNMLCPLCDVYLKDYNRLYNHLKLKHANQDDVSILLADTKALMRVTCDQCSKVYSSKDQLMVHASLVHTDHKKVECSQCGVVVKSELHLRGHIRRVHNNDTSHKFLCHLCPARFRMQSYLTTHIKFVHTSNKKDAYKCDQCEHTSTCLKYLDNHKKRVHNVRKYACHYCKQLFNTAANMQRHERLLHERRNEKPHVCETCGKRFTLKANMKHHTLTVHKKHFLYQCLFCKKGFPRQKLLHLHSSEAHSMALCNTNRTSSVCRSDSSESHEKNITVAGSGPLHASPPSAGIAGGSTCRQTSLHTGKYIVATPEIRQTFRVKDGDLA